LGEVGVVLAACGVYAVWVSFFVGDEVVVGCWY
jgi:hypothetical protein